ncbi:MAG: DegT/DnrJ/EryC1/StrS family aminotransferase [Bacteroidaceae bacterium]|nr:DegT/DnrJ/EryC1/StrS family aminotransferase [Bacteroidaceae bacterium]MBQ9642306.1 DegT/DnrJ/EryC1/StrS family aminotransferase [Bacteroidaceae bacterium]
MIPFLDLQAINHSFGQPLIDAATQTIRSGWYLHGNETAAFEAEWGEYCGAPYVIGVGNGLDALRLTLQAWKIMLNWEDGDEVIVPANTFIATPLAVSQVGLKPVFCEVNFSNALIRTDSSYLKTLLTPRTRCIIPVHLYGQLANLTEIYRFAQRHLLQVLEDACQAHGARSIYNNNVRTCAYSFYPGKNLGALGDGGCVTTHDGELAALVRNLANYGQTEKYIHDYKGINSRLDELQAAILRVKLRRLDADNRRRQQIAQFYAEQFAAEQPAAVQDGTHVYHVYPYLAKDRTRLQQHLQTCGVQTQIHYPVPCHQQKAYADAESVSLPAVEYWCSHELSLPISPVLTDEQAEHVVKSVQSFQI